MKLPCPSCEVNQGGVTRLLWNADSPIGWTCTSCKGRFRLASPWLTGIIAVVFGLLVLGSFILRDTWLPGVGPWWGGVITALTAGAAIWVAHEVVFLLTKKRLVKLEDAPAGAQAYVLAFMLGMAFTFALLYGWVVVVATA